MRIKMARVIMGLGILVSLTFISGCIYSSGNSGDQGVSDGPSDSPLSSSATHIIEQLPQHQQVWTTSISALSVASPSGRLSGVLAVNPNSVNQRITRPRYQLDNPVLGAKKQFFESESSKVVR